MSWEYLLTFTTTSIRREFFANRATQCTAKYEGYNNNCPHPFCIALSCNIKYHIIYSSIFNFSVLVDSTSSLNPFCKRVLNSQIHVYMHEIEKRHMYREIITIFSFTIITSSWDMPQDMAVMVTVPKSLQVLKIAIIAPFKLWEGFGPFCITMSV